MSGTLLRAATVRARVAFLDGGPYPTARRESTNGRDNDLEAPC